MSSLIFLYMNRVLGLKCSPLRRLDRLTQAAEELSRTTGRTCIAAQADVRKADSLKEAVAKTIANFGRIDYVICGSCYGFFNVAFPPCLR